VEIAGQARGAEPRSVVVVDDDAHVLRTLARTLGEQFEVVTFESAAEAVERVRHGGVSVVLTDINMPGMTGLDLLRAIRHHDADLPVVLITGDPTVQSAAEAIEHGVFGYLSKPFEQKALRSTVERATQLYRLARMKREALDLVGAAGASDRAGLEVIFERALASLFVDFQPIVSVSGHSILGYEALMRNTEPALSQASQVLDAAERLDAVFRVGRLVRAWAAWLFQGADPECLLFLNLHPRDLMDPDLLDADSPLSKIAHRVVLEITERTSLERIGDVRERVAVLRSRGFRIAIDDLGAGFAGLTSFALLEPDIVKLDMSLTRDVDQSPVKQKLVGSMTALCREMAMKIVVEGVETPSERDTLMDLGCDLHQGYLFARPGPPFPSVSWHA
jgi:EAL domain-containing protein (putative c-di-GMP-specific phosphodiesterase class I)